MLRQTFSMLLVVIYMSATIIAVVPVKAAPARASDMAHAMMTHTNNGMDGTMPMPCKSMKPGGGCVTDAGCIFMLSLAAPHVDVGAPLAWAFVNFPMVAETVLGHSIKPLLGPPISRA